MAGFYNGHFDGIDPEPSYGGTEGWRGNESIRDELHPQTLARTPEQPLDRTLRAQRERADQLEARVAQLEVRERTLRTTLERTVDLIVEMTALVGSITTYLERLR